MSVINTNQYSILGISKAFYAIKNGVYPYGTVGTLANGSGAGMGVLRGVQNVNITEPQAGTVTVAGDNGVTTVFKTQPTELPSGEIVLGAFNQNFASKANGTLIYVDGDWDESGGVPLCYSFADTCMVLNSPASAQESSNLDQAGWVVTELLNLQIQAATINQMQSAAAVAFSNNATLKRSSASLAGRAFSIVNDGSTAFAVRQYMSDYPVTYHTFIGDASATTVTLDETPVAASGSAVQLWQNGTKKTYTTHYTIDATTKVLTFVAAPTAGMVNIVRYKYVPGC